MMLEIQSLSDVAEMGERKGIGAKCETVQEVENTRQLRATQGGAAIGKQGWVGLDDGGWRRKRVGRQLGGPWTQKHAGTVRPWEECPAKTIRGVSVIQPLAWQRQLHHHSIHPTNVQTVPVQARSSR